MEYISTFHEPIRVPGVSMKIAEKIPILHRLGMHLRAGAELVKVTSRFKSRIQVSGGGHAVNAKSILGLLTIGAIYGTVLEFSAEGEDASQAIQAIRELLKDWERNGK
jgi:phosphocarrier protein